MGFRTHPAESPSPFLKKRWNDSEGMSHVPLHRGGLLTRAADISFSLASMRGVSWLGFGVVAISKRVVKDRRNGPLVYMSTVLKSMTRRGFYAAIIEHM